MMKTSLLTAVALVALVAADATAQSEWKDKGWVSVDFGSQGAPPTLTQSATDRINVETATLTTSYPFKSAPQFNVNGGVRLWRNLGVGVGVSYTTQTDTAAVSAQIPHPFFFNQPRAVSGEQGGIVRRETGVHVMALWMIPAGERLQIGVSGGPSFYSAKQDLITTVTYSESYPYDTATFSSATTGSQTKNATGFNAGVDVAYMFQPKIGVGGSVHFSRAQPSFDLPDGSTLKADVGGTQYGGGVRFRF